MGEGEMEEWMDGQNVGSEDGRHIGAWINILQKDFVHSPA